MSFAIYKNGDDGRRWFLAELPDEDNPLSSIGYRGSKDGSIPSEAGTCPTEADAVKLCDHLRTAGYGPPQEHFYVEVEP